ncbi:MAG: hypothetical protein ACYCQJ_03695 [Nitrososphaerales archaeon]
MTGKYSLVASLALITIIVLCSTHTFAASSADFSSANNAIASAFAATSAAEQRGGNVTGLTTMLNEAAILVQKAQSENSTNPNQSTLDLQNATQIANKVSSLAPSVGDSGAFAKEVQTAESIGASIGIVVGAILLYIFGERLYRVFWLYLYRNYTLRSEQNG